jgi:hypothetical protein
LIEVVMGINEAGQKDVAVQVQDLVSLARQVAARANLFNESIANEQTGVGKFAAQVVEGGHQGRMTDKQCAHRLSVV